MTLISYKDVRKLEPGTPLMIVERFGQPHIERLVFKSRTSNGFIAAPVDNINADRSYKCDSESFAPSDNGFALQSQLGRIAVRFVVLAPR